MKTSHLLATTLTTLLFATTADAAQLRFKATLSGAQEVPPVSTTATGTATITYDDVTRELTGTVTYSGLSGPVANAHFHKGAVGASGPVAVGIQVGPSPLDLKTAAGATIQFAATDPHEADLKGGLWYINLHTAANAGGEIRGQVVPDDGADAGSDAGTDSGAADAGSDAGSPGDAGSGGSSGSSGATTTRPDAGTTSGGSSSDDDGGCSTTGNSAPGGALAVALAAGVAVLVTTRKRRGR